MNGWKYGGGEETRDGLTEDSLSFFPILSLSSHNSSGAGLGIGETKL